MSASLLVFNSPLRLGWKNNAAEALNLGLFAVFAWYSIVQFRRNNRVYAFVMVTALIYGVSLELMGMATVNLYTQGPFTVMLNFPVIPLFEGTTAMPLYVSIYYPVIFMTGFKVLEGLGIATRWRAAVAGGLFLICQEAPFVIQGGLTDVRWFTWRHDPMLQFFMGWPLVDMYWQITWGTVFFYLVLRARANIDGAATAQRWSTGRALGLWAPVVAAAVIVVGCILFAPIILAKVTIGRHWPVLAVLVAGYLVVTVTALRAAQPPSRRIQGVTLGVVVAYVGTFAAMVIANAVHEEGITAYMVVQTLGLIGVTALATFPLWSRQDSEAGDSVGVKAQGAQHSS